jgi:hypothetical protein
VVNKLTTAEVVSAARAADIRRAIALSLVCVMLLTAVPGFAGPPKVIDPAAVKAKVEKLGVGEHVMVKRTEGPALHGRITGIEQDAFTIHPDNTSADVLIAYDQVLKVRKNPGPIGWMLVGAVIVIVIIVATR